MRIAILWALVGLVLAAPAGAATAKKIRSSSEAPQALRAGTKIWTDAEMRAAIPMDLRQAPARTNRAPLATGVPGRIRGRAPQSRVRVAEPADGASDLALQATADLDPLSYTYPAPYSRYEVFQYTKYPFRTVGKVFFTQNGDNFVCSAAVIAPYSVWTAGHCMHDGSGSALGWSYNVVFIPGYKNGAKPLGQWPMQPGGAWTTATWYASGLSDLSQDYGGATLKKIIPPGDTVKRSISYVTGTLGFAYNVPTNQHWFSIGYPAAAPFNGERMHNCAASYAYSDTGFSPNPSGIGCDMTGGCSGGPWIVGLNMSKTEGNFLNGNNSYRATLNTQEMYTPYLDGDAKNFYDCLQVATPSSLSCD